MVEIAILTSEKVPFRGIVPFFDNPTANGIGKTMEDLR